MPNIMELPIVGIVASDGSSTTVAVTTNILTSGTGNNARTIYWQPEDATITDVGIQLYSSTGTAARDFRVNILDESLTVIARTADYAYNSGSLTYDTNGALTILPIAFDGSGNSISSINLTKGVKYTIEIIRTNNTGWSTSNYITVGSGPSNSANTNDWWAFQSMPTFQGSSTGNNINGMNSVVYSSTKCYGKGYGGHGTQSISSGTTTNYGNRFEFPVAMGSFVEIGGLTFSAQWDGGAVVAMTGDLRFKVWKDNNNGTATELLSFDVGEEYHETSGNFARYIFPSTVQCATGTKYIITISNVVGTGILDLNHYTYTNSKENTIFTSNYIPVDGVEVSSGGTITAVTKTYHINPILENFINPSGYQATFGSLFNG